jgi:hypothetical protein
MGNGHLRHLLVIAPARVRDATWKGEHLKWEHLCHLNVECYPALGEKLPEVTIVSFNQAAALLADPRSREFDGLIVDEVTRLQQPGGAWFKALRPRLKQFKWRVAMSGTLASEGVDKLYVPAMVCDLGKALGTNKDKFLQTWFYPTDYNQYNWKPKEGAQADICRRIAPFTFTIDRGVDDQGLPPKTIIYHALDMADQQAEAYQGMARDFMHEFEEHGELVTAINAAVAVGKLQQIANGFLYSPEGIPRWFSYAKMVAVQVAVDSYRSSGHDGGTVVVYQYRAEKEWLETVYPDAGVLGGGVTPAQAEQTVEKWNRGKLKVLLLHPASAGHGLNLQFGGHHIVFVGPIWSRDQTEQVIARLWRRGQTHEVLIEAFCMRDSVETDLIMYRLKEKETAEGAFRKYLEKATGKY